MNCIIFRKENSHFSNTFFFSFLKNKHRDGSKKKKKTCAVNGCVGVPKGENNNII